MQYHLDTIPVWNVMELHCECPLCALQKKVEADEAERNLGGSVMEPDARIQVNHTGICQEHNAQLFALQNRLGHALLIDSHTKEQLSQLEKLEITLQKSEKGRGILSGKANDPVEHALKCLDSMRSGCVICDTMQIHMERYLYTFLHLWKNEAKFREQWQSSKGVCVPHAVELLRASQKHLNGKAQQEFCIELIGLLRQNLMENEKDLEWFTLKFDYRNQAKPWGNSKTALERTINRLRGWCVGEPPYPKER